GEYEDFVNLPIRKEINYVFKEGKDFVLGNTFILHSNYVVNQPKSVVKFTNEVKVYDTDAFNKSDDFWAQNRPIQMQEKELQFIHFCDSLKAYFESPEYYKL